MGYSVSRNATSASTSYLSRPSGFEDPLAVGVQAVLVEVRVVAHDVAQRGEAAVVHVRRGARHVAQRRHLELAEVAVLERDVPRAGRGAPRRVVVVRCRAGCRGSPELADARRSGPDRRVPARRRTECRRRGTRRWTAADRRGTSCSCRCRRRSRGRAARGSDSAPSPPCRRARARRGSRRTACAGDRASPGTRRAPWPRRRRRASSSRRAARAERRDVQRRAVARRRARAPRRARRRRPSRAGRASAAGSAPTGCRCAPSQPYQRWPPTFDERSACCGRRARVPCARGRPSVNARAGRWQVAHAMPPVLRQRRVVEQPLAERDRRRRCPTRDSTDPATRGGGHGPSATMRLTSASVNTTGGGACAARARRRSSSIATTRQPHSTRRSSS